MNQVINNAIVSLGILYKESDLVVFNCRLEGSNVLRRRIAAVLHGLSKVAVNYLVAKVCQGVVKDRFTHRYCPLCPDTTFGLRNCLVKRLQALQVGPGPTVVVGRVCGVQLAVLVS